LGEGARPGITEQVKRWWIALVTPALSVVLALYAPESAKKIWKLQKPSVTSVAFFVWPAAGDHVHRMVAVLFRSVATHSFVAALRYRTTPSAATHRSILPRRTRMKSTLYKSRTLSVALIDGLDEEMQFFLRD
jgi:uncharacterized membrane protein